MIHQSSQPELSSAKNWINRNENSMVPSRCCLMSTLLNRYSANLKGRFLFTNLAIDSIETQQTAARVRIDMVKATTIIQARRTCSLVYIYNNIQDYVIDQYIDGYWTKTL